MTRIELNRDGNLVWYRFDGSDQRYCTSRNGWRQHEIERQMIDEHGVAKAIIDELRELVRQEAIDDYGHDG